MLCNYRGVDGSEAFPGPTDQVCGAAGADPDYWWYCLLSGHKQKRGCWKSGCSSGMAIVYFT